MSDDFPRPALSPESTTGAAAVVVAAGKGLRAGQPLPKQFANWRGKPVLRHSVEALADAGICPIVIVIPPDTGVLARELLAGINGLYFTAGGETRQESVRLGLEVLVGAHPGHVLIHDAARPVIPGAVIERLLSALHTYPAAIPVLPVVDSLAHSEEREGQETMGACASREHLRRVQTPQAFAFETILEAHRHWEGALGAGDDAQVAQAWGCEIALVEGDEALHKLTYSHDFAANQPPIRVGTGYDVHQLAAGEELWLCGVKIEHSHGLAGHSDADVAIHALVDALLGAIGAGDIGQHFPPSDARWKGAASDRFLAHAAKLVGEAGYALGNADLTIICEAPKIGPHREAMRHRLAAILEADVAQISVKATTSEKLGFTGRREGIAAQAAVSLVRN